MIGVQPTAFGDGKTLPFDLAHIRHPISYVAEPGDAKKRDAEKAKLTDVLFEAFQTVVMEVIEKEHESVAADATEAHRTEREDVRTKFEADVLKNTFRGVNGNPSVSFSMIPVIPLKGKIDLPRLMETTALPPMDCSGWTPELFGRSFLTSNRTSDDEGRPIPPSTATELSEKGVVRALDHLDEFHESVFYLRGAEQLVYRFAALYLGVLRDNQVAGPIEVRVMLAGTMGKMVFPSDKPSRLGGRKFTEACYKLDVVTLPASVTGGSKDVPLIASLMREPFEVIWRDAGFDRDPNFDSKGNYSPETV